MKKALSILVFAGAATAAAGVFLGAGALAGNGTACSAEKSQHHSCESAVAQLLRNPSTLTPRRVGSVVFTNSGTAITYDVTLQHALPNTTYALVPNSGHERGNVTTDADGDGYVSISLSCPFLIGHETTQFELAVISETLEHDGASTRIVTLARC